MRDLFMPGREGLATIRELYREFPALLVVAMSGGGCHRQLGLLAVARQLGATQTLSKPFGRQDILVTVERGLEAHARSPDRLRDRPAAPAEESP